MHPRSTAVATGVVAALSVFAATAGVLQHIPEQRGSPKTPQVMVYVREGNRTTITMSNDILAARSFTM